MVIFWRLFQDTTMRKNIKIGLILFEAGQSVAEDIFIIKSFRKLVE